MNLRHRLDRLARRQPLRQTGVLVIRRGATREDAARARAEAVDIIIRRLDSDGVVHELFIPGAPDEAHVPGDWRPVSGASHTGAVESPC